MRALAASCLCLVAAAACSADRPEPRPALPVPTFVAPAATASASAPAPAPTASAEQGPPDPLPRIARAMFPEGLDPNTARCGWLPSKKAFLLAEGSQEDLTGGSLALVIAPEKDADRRAIPICAAGDCGGAPARAALIKALRDNDLSETIVLDAIDFPDPPKQEVVVGSLAARVVWSKDHLQIVRKGAAPQRLPAVSASPPYKPEPISVVASPDGSMMAFTYGLDPGKKAAEGYSAPTRTVIYRVP